MNRKEMPAGLPEQEFESPVEPTTPSRPHPVQDAALALSLANLCFIEAWFAMLFDSDFGYFNKTRVTASTLWAVTFAICASAFVVWLIALWVRRSQSRVLEMTTNIGLCSLILIPMDFVRRNY